MEIKGKQVTVVGLARSGVGAANLLSQIGASVTVTDIREPDELSDAVKRLSPQVRLVLGSHPDGIFQSADMIVVSPGVPLAIAPLASARAKGIPVIGELELAYQIVRSHTFHAKTKESGITSALITDASSPLPIFLAVTGSNGKSTTTTLLNAMLVKHGSHTILGGNIGNALTEEVMRAGQNSADAVGPEQDIDCIVTEVSSFQLESIEEFRPHIASILNITPDHMDRYHSLDEYSDAKARILLNQKQQDFLVINADDPETVQVVREKMRLKQEKPKIYSFSRTHEVEGIYCKNGIVYCTIGSPGSGGGVFELLRAEEIRIKGVHNLENAMAASAMALLANCSREAVIDTLRNFEGLEHRLEFVRELDGVKYINDSKGTNVGAVIKSLESFSEPLILIAGGRDKAGDFSMLKKLVDEKVRSLILIGEAAEKIRTALDSTAADIVMAKDFREAVQTARAKAAYGDVVLLSPACASFDMFLDYEDRGRQFKKIVAELTG